jgi:hypothetical protein
MTQQQEQQEHSPFDNVQKSDGGKGSGAKSA